jgi:hypothetical protein
LSGLEDCGQEVLPVDEVDKAVVLSALRKASIFVSAVLAPLTSPEANDLISVPRSFAIASFTGVPLVLSALEVLEVCVVGESSSNKEL